jgi:AcrR family transcriptional regulator
MTTRTEILTTEVKIDRRTRIMLEARALLAQEGFEGLSLRKLADRAGVTVPTVYNLVGGKEQILLELVLEMIAVIKKVLESIDEDEPLTRAEAIVLLAIAEIERAPDFHRAALLAIDAFDRDGAQTDWDSIEQQAAEMQEEAAKAARRKGLLEGRINANLIAAQIFRTYRSASRDWAFRRCDLVEFRRIALTGVYLGLAADASETFRRVLVRKLKALGRRAEANVKRDRNFRSD